MKQKQITEYVVNMKRNHPDIKHIARNRIAPP